MNEHHNAGNINIKHVSGDNQKADILTKPLHKGKYISNRNWLLSSSIQLLALLTLLSSLVISCTAIRLEATQPVYYKSSDIRYVNQLQRFLFKVIIINPCETYFANITTKPEINSKLIKDCDDAYKKLIRLDNCQNYRATRSVRDVQSGTLSNPQDFLTMVGETIGVISPKEEETKQIQVTTTKSNQVTSVSNSSKSTELSRGKRPLPLLATVGLVVVGGLEAHTSYRVDVNTSNIKKLAEAVNSERKFISQAYETMNEIRISIHGVNRKIIQLEQRLDNIDQTMEQFPKIVALINLYDNQFEELAKYLSEMDNASLDGRASTAIFRIAKNNSFIGYEDDQLQLESCHEDIKSSDKHLTFEYQFLMSLTNRKVRIMKAASFRFWNLTIPHKYCWMKYSGPGYIMVNTTNSCQQDVQEFWINDRSISSHPCNRENQQLEQIQQLYHPDVCRDKFKGDPKDIQLKQYNGLYKIYCFGNNRTIESRSLQCPGYIFELPISDKFSLAGETYDLGEVSTVTINAVELHINNELEEQLKVHKVKIYGINTTRLDSSFERLSRLTTSVMKNVTIIESPIGNWLFDSIGGLFNWFEDLFTKFGAIIQIILIIGTIMMLFPVFGIGMLIVRVGYSAVISVLTYIQRSHDQMRSRSRRRVSRNRIRQYLLE